MTSQYTNVRHFALGMLAFLLATLSFPAFSQLGQQSPKTKWMQLRTPKVQVVYAKGLEGQARRVAALATYLADSTQASIGSRTGRITIILRNQTGVPNGFVAYSPFRSEFFMNGPQEGFSGTTDWLDLLSVHEYRHVQQFINSKVGITKAMSILFGQNGWGFMSGMALPRWFMEGDAVVAETALSHSGRGRTPSFDMEYRALRTQGFHYNYEKASADSYKHFVPSHYPLGYNLVSYGRLRFGQDVWAKVLNDAARYKSIFYPFSRSLKRHTGLTTKQLYKETMAHLDSLYTADAKAIVPTPAKQLSAPVKLYTSYEHPRFTSDSTLLVAKGSYDKIRCFYSVNTNTGQETRWYEPGLVDETNFTLDANDYGMVWSELAFSERWESQEFYNIYIGLPAVGKNLTERPGFKQKLTSRKRYLSPTLSPNGQLIAAIQSTDLQVISIDILSATGQVLRTLPNKEGYNYNHLRWDLDGTALIGIVRKHQQNALARIDAQTGAVALLTDFTTELITFPTPAKEAIFFTATHTGISNIFAVKRGKKALYQVTSSQIGAFQPAVSPNGRMLAYTEFSATGHQLMLAEVRPETWKAWTGEGAHYMHNYRHLAEQEGGDILSDFDTAAYLGNAQIKPYKPLPKLLNIHSWNPVLSDPSNMEGGIDLMANDKLGTFSATASYRYNVNEARGRVFGEIAYGGLFPIIRAGMVGKAERAAYFLSIKADTVPVTDTTAEVRFSTRSNERLWQEQDFYVGVDLPFNLTKGNFFTNLELTSKFHWLDLQYGSEQMGTSERINALELGANFSSIKRRAKRQIYPRLGFGMEYLYRGTLGSEANQGQKSLLWLYGYLPSPVSSNHGFLLTFVTQQGKMADSYQFRNLMPSARGYGSVFANDGASRVSVNYGFPIAYPDWNIGPFLFLQRLKGVAFFDQATFSRDRLTWSEDRRVYVPEGSFSIRSVGMELSVDTRFLRLLDASFGVRYSYLLDANVFSTPPNQHQFEFILLSITP